ncbi:hypothetical protein C8F01DRAFT_962201, partial [Mycena amicta]
DPSSHRGRAKERELQRLNLQALLNVRSNKEFWEMIRDWTDKKRRDAAVGADELGTVFELRLNPPDILPHTFDIDSRLRHQRLVDDIPDKTFDTTPAETFSRPFAMEEVENAKLHIRKHNTKSAR